MSDPTKVDSRTKSVRELLSKVKYDIDVFQREYRWQTKHIAELLKDLEDRFTNAYDPGHERTAVRDYPHYFLGSIIISARNGHNYIIDGQQRLTSLTLLLIFLQHLQRDSDIPEEERVDVRDLIFSIQYGTPSYNLDLPERKDCLDALYRQTGYDTTDASESNQNLIARYHDIEELFPETLKGATLPYFVDWLIDNVDLAQITAFSDEEAYTIFETMNDRGLRLSPTEMLKGYLLTSIDGEAKQRGANQLWRQRILGLIELDREEELDFFKNWLRAKYAKTIRPRKRGASNQDFEKLGTAYHKWVRDNAEGIGLKHSKDYELFVRGRFSLFSQQYIRIGKAKRTLTPGLELIYYNNAVNFTLQDMLLLAPITVEDTPDVIDRKFRLVSTYIDIFVARRIVNFRTLRYSSIVYTMFNLMNDIRDLGVVPLATLLKSRVDEMEETFSGVRDFCLHQQNRRYVHYLLARMTYYIESQSGLDSHFDSYVAPRVGQRYEVEHVLANTYDHYASGFGSKDEFEEWRNRFGGLLLLPRRFNQSYGAAPYSEKVEHYFGQNLLARSLSRKCYTRNPGFRAFMDESGLPFQPHSVFDKAAIEARQELYRQLCEVIWSPSRFDEEFPKS